MLSSASGVKLRCLSNLCQRSAPAVKSVRVVVADDHDVSVVVFVGVGADVKLARKFRKRLQGREARVESGAQLVLGFESRSKCLV